MLLSQVSKILEKKNVTIDSTSEAVKKYPEIKNYFFKLVPYDLNELTAYHAAHWSGGVYIHANGKFQSPINAYFLLLSPLFSQLEHTIVVLEPNSEITVVEGCTAPIPVRNSIHVGINELYVKKNARLNLIKLQNWPSYVHTRPITKIKAEKGTHVNITNIILGGGASTIETPIVELGEEAKINSETLIFSDNNSLINVASYVTAYRDSSTVLLSKTIAGKNSKVIVRDNITAEGKAKGHISCDGLLLSKNAQITSVPSLSSHSPDANLSHEAAIGKLNEESLFYLRSRGLSEKQAETLLIEGFMSPLMKKLPILYRQEVKKIIELKGGM